MTFAPNCKVRARCAPDGWRKLPGEFRSLLMPFHCVWLKTLNASARNSNPAVSVNLKCLNRAMSKFVVRGFRRLFLPEFPNVSPCGAANVAGLYKNGGVPGSCDGTPDLGLPTISA